MTPSKRLIVVGVSLFGSIVVGGDVRGRAEDALQHIAFDAVDAEKSMVGFMSCISLDVGEAEHATAISCQTT